MSTTRFGPKATISIATVLVCGWLLVLHFYLQWDWVPQIHTNTDYYSPPPPNPTLAPAQIVVASLKSENTAWVHQHLPSWSRSIYVVDNPSAPLTVPRNRGREAMVYLTHLIDAYDTLAPTTIFVHASRFAWHNDDPDYDALATLRRLNLTYVQSAGYVNLRCVWTLGCPAEIRPHDDAMLEGGGDYRNATSLAMRAPGTKLTAKEVYKQAFEELMPGVEVPEQVGVSCCSQFAVSREAVRARPKEDYVRWREWLLETPLEDDLSGRVFEYLWHIIFGKDAIFCPSAEECYCKLFGLCELKCSQDQCDGRYVLPKYSTLPKGWPKLGWEGEARNYTGSLKVK